MSDLAVSIGIGATMQASVGAVVGSTVRHIDKLRKSTEALQQRAQRVKAYRELESGLARTRNRARQATERVAKMGAAMRQIQEPSQAMRDALGKARAEANRLNERVSEQSQQLGKLRRQMRAAGESTDNLDARERELTRTLEAQRARLDRLNRAYSARDAARERRGARRGELFDAVALGTAVLGPIVASTRAAIRFESVMADVRKVVDFDTPEQFAAMSQDVLQLSERIPVAASGIGDIVAAAGQAGIAREELTRFAEDAAKVAVAFDIAGAEAGGRLTGLRSIFRLGQDEVMRLAGAYNHLSNNMDATAPAMLNVAERTGSVATQFGLTGEQTGALAATLLALKTPPEVAGTAINALLVKLGTAPEQPKKFQAALDELGISALDLKDDIGRDAQGALLNFLSAVDQADDKQSILFALFGQEYVDDITKLAGGIDIYRESLRLASDDAAAATSIQEEYAARAATTENQIELLKNKTNALGVNIGGVLLPAVNDAVGGIGDLVSKGAALAQEYPGVTKVVIGLVGGLVGLRVASAFGNYATTFLSEGWAVGRIAMLRAGEGVGWLRARLSGLSLGSIPTAVRSLGLLRLALLSTGVGAAVVALGVGAALVMRYWEPLQAFFTGFGTGFYSSAIAPIVGAFKPLEPVFGWLGDVLGWIGQAFASLSEPVQATNEELEGFRSTGEAVGNFIGNAFRLALLPVTTLVKGVGTALKWLGVLDDTEVEVGIKSVDESGDEPDRRPPSPSAPRRGVVAAAAIVGATAAAPAAAAPDFQEVTSPVPRRAPAFPDAASAVIEVAEVRAQVQGALAGLGGLPPAGADDEGSAAFERIEAGLAALGEAEAVPRASAPQGVSAGQPDAAPAAPLVFHQTFHFHGMGPEAEEEITRIMERIMRRASVEADLAAEDTPFLS